MSIFEKNKGTVSDPFKIYTEDDLIELTNYGDLNNSDLHYQLQNDIHLVKEWVRGIGDSINEAFAGTFDGNGYTISNLFNSNITSSFFGLFRYTQGATIKNLEINGVNYSTSQNYSSGLVGVSNSGTLNIVNTAVKNVEINITASNGSRASAFVGACNGGHLDIKNSYAHNVRITRKLSDDYGSGVIVGYIQNRNVSVENVFIFGDIYLYSPGRRWGASSRLDYGELNGGSFNGNLIQATTSSTHNLSRSQIIQTPLVKDSYSNIVTFGPEEAWDMVDGELPFLTYLGTRVNPRKISVKEDLSLIDEFSYDYFELVNDIEVNTRYSSYVFKNSFYGTINGNGYGLYGIDIYDYYNNIALFQNFYGYIKDIEIEMDEIYVHNKGIASVLASSFGGKARNIRVKVGELRGGENNYGFLGLILEGADVKNCFIYMETISIYSTRNIFMLGSLPRTTSGNNLDASIENNIFHVDSTDTRSSYLAYSTNRNIKDNVVYVRSGSINTTWNGQATIVSSLNELRNPDNSAYDSFDKDKWVFEDDEDPIQSVFIKITEKIEERLISLYSKGMYLESKWTKGFKNILNFFTNKSGSSTRTKRSPFRRLLSFTKDISLKMLFKKRGRKRVKSNSGLVVSNITKLKKLTETILSYSNKITSNYSKIKSGAKILEIYSDRVSFRTTEIKKSLKKAVNYSKGIRDNLLRKITRRHNRKTQSFSGNIGSDVFHSYLTRVTEKVMSYSGHMRSIIRRASNKYEFEFRMVSNQANKITIRFKRFIRTMRTTKSHSGMMTTFVRRLSRVSAPTEIFARAIARTNSVKMRVKESFTKIRASNGGGD